jgi:hypothetical protein
MTNDEAGDVRAVSCHACGADITFVLKEQLDEEPIRCRCGATFAGGAARLLRFAGERLSLEAASAIAAKYTYEQIMDISRRGHAAPASLKPEEVDAALAFLLLRGAGLPSHAPPKSN